MPDLEQEVRGTCPACGEDVDYLYKTENIPYFSDILIISVSCPLCGYRFSDVQSISVKKPVRCEFQVQSPDDLCVRVVRSTAATVSIPELGVEINPGPACEGFVSNIEGILVRVEKILDTFIIEGDTEQVERSLAMKEEIQKIKEGKIPITVIIDDPQGNSVIDSDRTKKEYSEEDSSE